jgi:hypothetical protein
MWHAYAGFIFCLFLWSVLMEKLKLISKVKYIRIIVRLYLVAFSCIWILYGSLDAWPINTEILVMTLLFLEYGMSVFIGHASRLP